MHLVGYLYEDYHVYIVKCFILCSSCNFLPSSALASCPCILFYSYTQLSFLTSPHGHQALQIYSTPLSEFKIVGLFNSAKPRDYVPRGSTLRNPHTLATECICMLRGLPCTQPSSSVIKTGRVFGAVQTNSSNKTEV
jgi:hypothetical protein